MDTESTANFSFGSLQIAGNTVIGTLNEGVEANWSLLEQVALWAQQRFDGAPWAYISNRVNSYSIDPLVYHRAIECKGLIAIALVCRNEQQIRNVSVEKLYCRDITLQHFLDLQQAIDWSNNIVDEAIKASTGDDMI